AADNMSAGRTGRSRVFHSRNAPRDGESGSAGSRPTICDRGKKIGRATLYGAKAVFAAGLITNMFL
ncbi:MAG: hypothetical protein DMF13_07375, partial [Verrucomicrobia bacterium]